MSFVTRFVFIVILCFGFGLVNISHADEGDWYKHETDSFILYSDLGPDGGAQLAKDLELFRFYLSRMTGVTPQPEAIKLPIYVFSNNKGFQDIIQNGRIGGLFSRNVGRIYAIANISKSSYRHSDNGVSSLYHEYVHYFMDRYAFASYPPWYREGLADFLSTFEHNGNEVTIGRPLPSRIQILKHTKIGFLKDLLEYRWGKLSLHGKSDSTIYIYAWGWLLTHMLHMDAEFRPHVNKLMQALNNGMDVEEAFVQNLGVTIRDIERKMQAFQRSGSLTLLTGEAPISSQRTVVNMSKLSAHEKTFIQFALREDFTGEDESHVELLSDINNSVLLDDYSTEETILRARINSHMKNWEEALNLVDSVLAENPSHELANFERTSIALQRIALDKSEREDEAKSADDYDEENDEEFVLPPDIIEKNNIIYEEEKQRLLRVLQANPTSVLANFIVAGIYREQESENYIQEATHWMRALRGQPQNQSLRFGLARALADLGEIPSSCSYLSAYVNSFVSYYAWLEVDKVMETIAEKGGVCVLPELERPPKPEEVI